MDKRKAKSYRDKLLERRVGLVGQVQAAEAYSRERDAEATQDPADMAANAYTKELLMSMSTNDRQLLDSIDAALSRTLAGHALAKAGQPERAVSELQRAAIELDARGAFRYRAAAARELRSLGHHVRRPGHFHSPCCCCSTRSPVLRWR